MSVPHIASMTSGTIVPSWLRGPRGGPPGSPPRGRSRASAGAPAPSRCATRHGAAAPTPCGSPRHERGCRRAPAGSPRRGRRQTSPHGPRPTSRRGRRHRRPATTVDACPGDAPDPADPGDTVAAFRGDRDDGAHRFDLRAAKGAPPASSRAIFVCRSSVSMVGSPTLVPAGRSSRRAHPVAAISGSQSRRRGRRRASRSGRPPSPRARAPPAPAARLAGAAAPPPACDPPSSAAPGRSRDRSDIRGLRARGSSALNVIHQGTSIPAQ